MPPRWRFHSPPRGGHRAPRGRGRPNPPRLLGAAERSADGAHPGSGGSDIVRSDGRGPAPRDRTVEHARARPPAGACGRRSIEKTGPLVVVMVLGGLRVFGGAGIATNSLSRSTPFRSSWQAMNSLAMRFMPSLSGVTMNTSARRYRAASSTEELDRFW